MEPVAFSLIKEARPGIVIQKQVKKRGQERTTFRCHLDSLSASILNLNELERTWRQHDNEKSFFPVRVVFLLV